MNWATPSRKSPGLVVAQGNTVAALVQGPDGLDLGGQGGGRGVGVGHGRILAHPNKSRKRCCAAGARWYGARARMIVGTSSEATGTGTPSYVP